MLDRGAPVQFERGAVAGERLQRQEGGAARVPDRHHFIVAFIAEQILTALRQVRELPSI